MIKKVKHIRHLMILTWSVLLCSVCVAQDIKTFDDYFKLLPRPQNVQSLNGEELSSSDIHGICLNETGAGLVIPGLLKKLPHLKTAA
jgi:hypothetical protein